ncbi:phosphoribosylglycinamide formyltransferase [Sphingomonas sp. NSE70-1]|uniref:Phosphoribosylglycinamide formyltransferase n=1 Tax=Sphingomonas caseinilyticus TaxID=2908205 RepID=A0ABT0RS94_9SPHN|nr:phosphoribosylglycinamide formyltransferase [Sphingomonas caseinilyticus]MCL6697703.1 phosphoribosylglycinamide formyltransferase [Sphingomonas caseinilyticus]
MAERSRIAILISGRGSNMAALIYASRADGCSYEVALVTGDKPQAHGLEVAVAESIAVEALDAKALGPAYWDKLHEVLKAADVDLIALAGFMRIIPDDFLARWDGRVVNIHPSLLPKHKGLATHEACLAARDKVTGATVHLVTPDLDSGEILGQVEVAVLSDDTAEALAERVLIAEHQLYPHIVSQFLGRTNDFDWITEKVGELALALQETTFQTSHGSPGWKVGSKSGSKFFAIMWNRHHGEESIGVLVKCSGQDEMAQLIEAEPDIYFRPAYYGPSDWIGIALDRPRVDWDHVSNWLHRSWLAMAPPRLTKLMRAAEEF